MADQMKALQSATSCIDEYIATLEIRKAKASSYREEQQIAMEFVQAFPEGNPEPGEESYSSPDTRVAFSLDTGCINAIMLNWDCTTGLADVKPRLKWLADRLGKYTINNDPHAQRKQYIFRDGRFFFQVFFWKPNAVCKFVQTGVKEEPVYEFKCSDGSTDGAVAE